MKTVRKYMTALLCLCISSFALTGYAQSGLEVGSLDVRMSDLRLKDVEIDGVTVSRGVVEAVYANRTNVPCSYTLERVSADGTVIETLESGVVEAGEAKLSSVVTTEEGYYLAKMWSTEMDTLDFGELWELLNTLSFWEIWEIWETWNAESSGLKAQDMTSSF